MGQLEESRYRQYPPPAIEAMWSLANASNGSDHVPVVHHNDVPGEAFRTGMTYQTLVGDERGSTPVRVGIQTSAPGYKTLTHSHPYMEILTVLEGRGEAWIEGRDDLIPITPGTTLVLPSNQKHWFRTTGDKPLVTYGVHASPHRIVNVHEG